MLSQKVGDFFAAPGLFCTIIEIEKSSFIYNVAKTQYKTNRLKVFFYSFTFVILSFEYFGLIGVLENVSINFLH